MLACSTLTNGNSESSGGILFQDDFSDPSSGWDRVRNDQGITDYDNGVYRIYVNDTNIDYWANPNLNFTDGIIKVEAVKVGGPDDNDYGIICRYQDVENFYFFIISSDGYYGIGKMKDEQQELISGENLLPSDEINQGEATNTIQADCIENTLTLHVNDRQLSQVMDEAFASGDVGLIAGTYDEGGTDIHFDDFRVLEP
jgi:hypothetical protein